MTSNSKSYISNPISYLQQVEQPQPMDIAEFIICGCRVVMHKQPPRRVVIMKVWVPPDKEHIDMVHEVQDDDAPPESWFANAAQVFELAYIRAALEQKAYHLKWGGLVH